MSIGFRDSLGAYGATAGAMAKRWIYAPDSLVAGAGGGGAPAYELDGSTKYLRVWPENAAKEGIWHFFLEPTAGSDTSDLILFKDNFELYTLCTLQLMTDGRVRLRQGHSGSGGTILYTSPSAIVAFDERKHWQVRFKAHLTAGELEIKIDDVQEVNETGLVTTTSASWFIGEATIGKGVTGFLSHPIYVSMDGDDPQTFLGEKLVHFCPANADVAAEQAQTGGTGGQPYTAVDDTALDEADYNEGDTDEQNEYGYANTSGLTGIVEVSKSCTSERVGGFVQCSQFIRSNGVRLASSTYSLSAVPSLYRTFGAVTDPDGGGAWTAAKVNALTGGETVGTGGD